MQTKKYRTHLKIKSIQSISFDLFFVNIENTLATDSNDPPKPRHLFDQIT